MIIYILKRLSRLVYLGWSKEFVMLIWLYMILRWQDFIMYIAWLHGTSSYWKFFAKVFSASFQTEVYQYLGSTESYEWIRALKCND